MKRTHEQVYLSVLAKRLTKLLAVVQKKKPGSGFTDAEIQAFSSFPVNENLRGLLDCAQAQQGDNWLVRCTPEASKKAALYYLQLKLAIISRLMDILNEVEPEQIAAVQKDLKRTDLETMKRSSLPYCKDKEFHAMLWRLRSTIDEHNDHLRSKKMDKTIKLYIPVLKYYAVHQKQLEHTKEWYDFLCISEYMLYGRKLNLLVLLRRVKK